MSEHVFSILEQAALNHGDRTAIIEGDKKISFSDMLASSIQLCEKLEAAAAPGGKGIALVSGNGSRFVSGLFACSKAGAVTMPVLPGTQGSEIENLLRDSSINLLLAEKGNRFSFSIPVEKTDLGGFELYTFREIISQDIAEIFPGAAFIRPSSGTTGKSKGVVISHRAVFERTAAANEGMRLDDESIMLWVLPMAFHFVVSVLLYVRYGVCMVICENFTAAAIAETANRFRATHLYASPLHFRLLASAKDNLKFETLKTAISTSALLEPAVSKSFYENYGIAVSQAYGIIEIGLPFINGENDNNKSESVGRESPAYESAILDEDMNEVPAGTRGAFGIKGPGMFSGYLWPVKKRDEVLVNGWFLTGDIAEKDKDGFVYIRGRSKSMINVSGNKVFPEEVEAVLKLHEDVVEARVYGGKHPVTGELVEAELVLKPSAQKNAEKFIAFCRERLVAYKVPQRIFFVEDIIKTPTGKISRA